MYVQYNPNPLNKSVIDCTVRALSKVLDMSWDDAYMELCLEGYLMKDMPSSNSVWGSLLKAKEFKQYMLPDTCPDCYTIRDFCEDNPRGTFVVATGGHIVAVVDGNYYDSSDSGSEVIIYLWQKEESEREASKR